MCVSIPVYVHLNACMSRLLFLFFSPFCRLDKFPMTHPHENSASRKKEKDEEDIARCTYTQDNKRVKTREKERGHRDSYLFLLIFSFRRLLPLFSRLVSRNRTPVDSFCFAFSSAFFSTLCTHVFTRVRGSIARGLSAAFRRVLLFLPARPVCLAPSTGLSVSLWHCVGKFFRPKREDERKGGG